MKGVKRPERRQRAEEALALVRLEGFGDRKPVQLSGGQRQRVALARAIVNHPQVLLLDEPLGALDLKLRQEMQIELKRIQQEVGITFVYVTHDQEEALTMSDRIAVFSQGRIEQIGTPGRGLRAPGERVRRRFVGISNLLERDGRRFTIRPEKIRLLGDGERPSRATTSSGARSARSSTPARSRATSSTSTRAARSSSSARTTAGPSPAGDERAAGRRSRGTRTHTFAIRRHGGRRRMRRVKLRYVALALVAVALAAPAAGTTKAERERRAS